MSEPSPEPTPQQSQEKPYLSFYLSDLQYSISTEYLEEIFLLPEVIVLPTAAPDIIGVFNFRGDLLPILDPRVSLGHTELAPYQTSDSIIVLHQDQLRIGLIVGKIGQVDMVNTADIHAIAAEQHQQLDDFKRADMVAGLIQSAEQPTQWVLNDPQQWLKYLDVQPLMAMQGVLVEQSLTTIDDENAPSYAVFCPEATPEERDIFRQRAQDLQASTGSDRTDNLTTLAIVLIESRQFGVDLLDIKEFAELNTITPVPCCPPHIVGNMNLRGEILTLVDLHPLMQETAPNDDDALSGQAVEPKASSQSFKPGESKAMVIEIEDYVVGVLIDEVSESMFSLNQKDLVTERNSETYLRGKFAYQGQTIRFLDLSSVVSQERFVVDEVV
ncbi:MAG: chemotaxis protein CheW [Cyanobacteria bacterium J06632_3]